MTIKEVKKKLGITDNDLAEFFQYKNDMAYRNSSARPRIENGVVKLYALMKPRAGQTKALPDVSNDDG